MAALRRLTAVIAGLARITAAAACGSAPTAPAPGSKSPRHRTFSSGLGKHKLTTARPGDTVRCTNGVGAAASVPKPGYAVGGNADAVGPAKSTSIIVENAGGAITVVCGW